MIEAGQQPHEMHLLGALASLNEIGAAINDLRLDDRAGAGDTLRLIVDSAIQVVPGASAVIYAYDAARGAFDPASRVSAGELSAPVPGDEPRSDGLGARAIRHRQPILSYETDAVSIHHVKVAAGARVVACFPLIVAERPLGALYVYRHEDRLFDRLELLMLENFVNLAAMALHQDQQVTRVQQDLARTEDELARLRRADLLISSRLGLQKTLDAILEMGLEMTRARYGIFRLVDRSGRRLLTAAFAGDDLGRPAVEALPVNATSIMGWVAKHRRPLLIADLRLDPWPRVYYPLDHDLEMRAELAVPLVGAGGRLEGVLNLESPDPGAFSEQDSRLLQSLATQAVIAIQEARLLDALQEMAERLLTESPQAVFGRLVTLACELLDTAAGTLWTLSGEDLVLQASSGGPPDWTPRAQPPEGSGRISLRGSLTGQAILRRSPVVVPDVRVDDRFMRRDLAEARGWAGALIVPLLVSETAEPLGALSVYSVEPGRAFAEWDKKVLAVLAHHAALAVQEMARREALRAAQERQAVAETFAAVGDIAANLMHRINNKVGTIPVRIEGIEDKCRPALAADPYLATNLAEIGRSAAEAMASMREGLFHLRPIPPAPVNVAACVREAIQEAGLPAAVVVRSEGLDDLPPVLAGPRQLALVFANLLENAATAMEGSGVISIRGELGDEEVVIVVEDSGPGIPLDQQARIFEFDYSGRKVHPAKLGFGLWWVRTLMTRFGATVDVCSDGRHGTAFTLRLPASPRFSSGQPLEGA